VGESKAKVTKPKSVLLRLSNELYSRMEAEAVQEGRTVPNWIRRVVTMALNGQQQELQRQRNPSIVVGRDGSVRSLREAAKGPVQAKGR